MDTNVKKYDDGTVIYRKEAAEEAYGSFRKRNDIEFLSVTLGGNSISLTEKWKDDDGKYYIARHNINTPTCPTSLFGVVPNP